METDTRVNMKKENSMEKGNMFGQMVLLMKEILLTAADMVKEAGSLPETMEIFISDLMKEIKKVGMGGMFGRMDVFMRDNSKTIWSNLFFI